MFSGSADIHWSSKFNIPVHRTSKFLENKVGKLIVARHLTLRDRGKQYVLWTRDCR